MKLLIIRYFLLSTQAIIRRAKKYGLCLPFHNKDKNPEAHAILKKMIALALLPPHLIREGLNHVKKLAFALGKKEGTLKKWKKLFKYFEKEWMDIVKPEGFSVFDALDRTNNCLERYHRDLNQMLIHHPSVKKFLGKYVRYLKYLNPY